MGRNVHLAVICWLTFSTVLVKAEHDKRTVDSAVVQDNESAESVPRLYQRTSATVYASGVPYTAHSIRIPAVVAGPYAAGSHITPVATGSSGLLSLKDSYGQFVQQAQSAYKPAYPQQFVALQDLPPHLAQPLVSAAAPSFNFKTDPYYFYGPQSYKIQELQLPANHATATQFSGLTQPLVFAEDLKSFGPTTSNTHEVRIPEHKVTVSNNQHQSSQLAQYLNHQTHQNSQPYHQKLNQQKFQRLLENPSIQNENSFKDAKHQASQNSEGQIQASPAQTSITTTVNGKKTVLNFETKPPLPLLDLSLLEPLKFDNPLVPQLQNYLPKVSGATYHKLPTYNVKKPKNEHKEFVITKTKTYGSGSVKSKPYNPVPKKQNKPQTSTKSSKPGITVKGYPNSGDYAYEINTPEHKETYKEQVIKYNKETNMKPVQYSYNEQKHNEPEVYTFVHSSKSPLKVTHVEYNSENDGPKHIVYNLKPEDKEEEETYSSDESSSDESCDDSGKCEAPSQGHDKDSEHYQSPKQHQNNEYSDQRHETPKYHQNIANNNNHHHESPQQHQSKEYQTHQQQSDNTPHNKYNDHHEPPRHQEEHVIIQDTPKEYYHQSKYHGKSQKHIPETHHYYVKNQGHAPPPKQSQQSVYILEESPKPYHFVNFHIPHDVTVHQNSYRQPHHIQTEHRGQEYKQAPNHVSINQESSRQSHTPKTVHRGQPNNYKVNNYQHVTQPPSKVVSESFVQAVQPYQPITPEYEEDIRLLPTHKPHAAPIKVNPSQHLPAGPREQSFGYNPTQRPENISPQQRNQNEQHYQSHNAPPQSYNSNGPYVQEKSKRILIQEKEESPDEKHMHTEHVTAEMIDREENAEEDFEKAYKESAFGFPAYGQEDVEKDVFDPDSYGVPRYHSEYKAEDSPFEEFQKDGDKFPKFARLAYKDSRDNNQEDYFLDFGVHMPESYTDRIKSKLEYYKMFKKNRPEKTYLFEDDQNKKGKKSEKFTLAPHFDFFDKSSEAQPKTAQTFAQYKTAPIQYEYLPSYAKETSRDSRAYASGLTPKYKTQFVEPQLQYGFEPIAAPILYNESEMAAHASSNRPESKNPGTRKKMFKEQWFMKKTTSSSKPS